MSTIITGLIALLAIAWVIILIHKIATYKKDMPFVEWYFFGDMGSGEYIMYWINFIGAVALTIGLAYIIGSIIKTL